MVLAAVLKNLGVYDPVARIRRVKSSYVETYEQELFLKNLPMVIDSRIIEGNSTLALAIAAQHLVQVFITQGEKLDRQVGIKVLADADKVRDKLRIAYEQIFDLVDNVGQGQGQLDKDEVTQWLTMCGVDNDVIKKMEKLMDGGDLSKEKFTDLMLRQKASTRRAYDKLVDLQIFSFDE